MNIEIKKSEKPIEYNKAIEYLENRVVEVNNSNFTSSFSFDQIYRII